MFQGRWSQVRDVHLETYNPESLIVITRHTWNLYRASKFYNLKYDTVKLKQYAARIRNELIQSIIDSNNDVAFDVKVKVLPELKESAEDVDSLQIEVFYRKGEDEPVLKYKGVILSWGSKNNANNLIQLPLLLCIGVLNITKIVHKALSNMFDCLLFPLRLSENDLMCLSAMLSDSDRKSTVTYNFSLHGSSDNRKMQFTLPSTLIKNLWNNIHPEESDNISYKEVQNYHRLLHDQLEANYGINLKFFKLNTIVMCDATITCEGKIRIHTEDAAVRILSFITDTSLILDSACPAMTSGINNTF